MNVITPKKPQAEISAEEKQRRQAAVDYARGSARLEGFVSSPFAEQMYERFINGEITAKELSAKISAHHTP